MTTTRYADTAQDGIIHHPSYVVYLEEARIAFFRSLGCDVNELEKAKKFCIVTELSVKYLKSLHSGEEIEVHVSLDSCSKVRFQLKYEIFRQKERMTTATTTHCFLNEDFKPIPILNEIRCVKHSSS